MIFKREISIDPDLLSIEKDQTDTSVGILAVATSASASLSFFDLCLPLPYRILLLVNIGIWLWFLNLKVCHVCNIDTLMVIRLSHPDLNNTKLLSSAWDTCIKVSTANGINYLLYLIVVSNGYYAKLLDFLPILGLVVTIVLLVRSDSKDDGLRTSANNTTVGEADKQSPEKKRFTTTLTRILQGRIDINLRNNDILLSDTFTSYSKILVDFLVYLTALLLNYQTLPSPTNLSLKLSKDHLKWYNLDLILSTYPTLIRLKQCLFEYEQSRRRNKQHLLNAIKYSTAFLPILANFLIRSGTLPANGMKLWYLAVFINSTYTFIWDIKYDWNFEMFTKFLGANGKSAPILRNRLTYPKFFYYLAIVIDFQLRYIWMYRIIYPDLLGRADHGVAAFVGSSLFVNEFGNFVLEILEIFRRWVWVFIKIETEYVKIVSEGGSASDPADIELQLRSS